MLRSSFIILYILIRGTVQEVLYSTRRFGLRVTPFLSPSRPRLLGILIKPRTSRAICATQAAQTSSSSLYLALPWCAPRLTHSSVAALWYVLLQATSSKAAPGGGHSFARPAIPSTSASTAAQPRLARQPPPPPPPPSSPPPPPLRAAAHRARLQHRPAQHQVRCCSHRSWVIRAADRWWR